MSNVGVLKPGTAIPTEFRGTTYRSRLEANVAQFLSDMGLKFEYEERSFLVNGKHYSPDFYLPEVDRYVEARGYLTETSEDTLESFVKQHGDLFVFYSDRAEHIQYIDQSDEIFRGDLDVIVCDHVHASLATLGWPSLRIPVGLDCPCWYCRQEGIPTKRITSLSIVMRSSVPVLVTQVGLAIQGIRQ